MYLEEARAREADLYRVGYRQIVPCTSEEIAQLEQRIGHVLPGAYREFLLWMGHSGGDFLRGSDCFYTVLTTIQEGARELLQDNAFPGALPDYAFVFFMHQGYQFNFFRLSEGDDPPVYWYLEEVPARTSFALLYPHFSDFMLTEINGHIALEESIQKHNKEHPTHLYSSQSKEPENDGSP